MGDVLGSPFSLLLCIIACVWPLALFDVSFDGLDTLTRREEMMEAGGAVAKLHNKVPRSTKYYSRAHKTQRCLTLDALTFL